ncbi:SDR family oxidoreductase [Methylocella tundrae]|uniref:Short-chain dehydrogenase/reductase SDR n=1 Tax=Methylocella tundrae TaxID=227605 RepID=A0A4U8Z6Z4_METTU|nr:SDR family oxidoreductase [Methylocella tundrae]WPP04612.1 SDR family oxidoreductase [Methylocella tundrae]VFU11045.1 Short-chain dehydrogenase/reductase SDR [Methylocella tundrae]
MTDRSNRGISPTALVTGGGRRIGLRISQRLARAGYAVILHCSPPSASEVEHEAARIAAEGGKAAALSADLSEAEATDRLIAAASALFGPLALLVNNASIFEDDSAKSFDVERFDRHFAVNLRAPCILARDFAAQARAGADAAVVNIVDQRVFNLTPEFFSYTLSKAALWAATQTMAQSFAPNVRVNAVGPGPVLPNSMEGEAGFRREVASVLLRRAVDPDDIADAVLYLAKARNVTGQMIAVDAGQHLSWRTPDIVL